MAADLAAVRDARIMLWHSCPPLRAAAMADDRGSKVRWLQTRAAAAAAPAPAPARSRRPRRARGQCEGRGSIAVGCSWPFDPPPMPSARRPKPCAVRQAAKASKLALRPSQRAGARRLRRGRPPPAHGAAPPVGEALTHPCVRGFRGAAAQTPPWAPATLPSLRPEQAAVRVRAPWRTQRRSIGPLWVWRVAACVCVCFSRLTPS